MFSGENIALGEPTLQSATLWSYEPGLGKDLTNIFHKFTFFSQWEEIVTDYVQGTVSVISNDPQCKDGNWNGPFNPLLKYVGPWSGCTVLNGGGRGWNDPILSFCLKLKLFLTPFLCNPIQTVILLNQII